MTLMELLKKKKEPELPFRRDVAVFEARPAEGLSTAQAKESMDAGWGNLPIEPPGKTGGAAAFSAVWEWNDKSRLNLSYDLSILKTEGSLML